ncbi:MAG: choice-of-anchor D domain-containing protein, partial [Candidatus Sulfotelmatobacter sp.]
EKVTISGVSSSQKDFKISGLTLPKVLTPGERINVTVTFSPSAKGVVNGRIVFASNASDRSLAIPVAGTGAATTSAEVIAAPSGVAFGNVGVGESSTLPVTLTNTGESKVTLEGSQVTGGVFSLTGAKFPLALAARESVKLTANFKPQAAGTIDGDVIFAGSALKVRLSGTGTITIPKKRELTLAPSSLNFGNVGAGTTSTLTVGLKATGSTVTVSSISSSNSQFEVSGEALPLTIPAGQEKLINVTFKPSGSGAKTGTLSIASNAIDSRASEALAGTGTALYVDLSWKPSTSSVKGYNIYRSKSATGSFTKINSTVDADTTYEDSTIASGNTYYYATTAVAASGKESAYSNRVEVVVP